jgi:hypothetical protein
MCIGDQFARIIEALSEERFGRYLQLSNGDHDDALKLYTLNSRLSESLYIPLQMLEISLRNRIHSVASQLPIGDKSKLWFFRPEFLKNCRQREHLDNAARGLLEPDISAEPGRVVAKLPFGYWTAFFGKDYENMWQSGLNRVAKREDGKGLTRKDFSLPLDRLRNLRNRIAHHEPIITGDLEADHDSILRITGWLSPAAQAWSHANSRFPHVLSEHNDIRC